MSAGCWWWPWCWASARLAFQAGCAWWHARRQPARPRRRRSWAPVSVIVPAYNEAANIARHRAVADRQRLPAARGDRRRRRLDRRHGRRSSSGSACPGVRVVAAAQRRQAGRAQHRHPARPRATCWCWSTATRCSSPTPIDRLVQPFADPRVGAVSGNTKVANRRRLLGRWQHLEYVIGFNLDRRMFDAAALHADHPRRDRRVPPRRRCATSAACRRTPSPRTPTSRWRCSGPAGEVAYDERAIAWTEAPATLRQLWRQRYRWCYGTMQAMWKHRGRAARARRRRAGSAGAGCRTSSSSRSCCRSPRPPSTSSPSTACSSCPGRPAGRRLAAAPAAPGADRGVRAAPGRRVATARCGACRSSRCVYRQLMYLVVVQAAVTALLGSRLRWHRMARTGAAADLVGSRR